MRGSAQLTGQIAAIHPAAPRVIAICGGGAQCCYVPAPLMAILLESSGVHGTLRSMGDRLKAVAAGQAGLFTRAQARACGYSAYQVRRRLGTGEWQHVLGHVLTAAGIPVTPLLRDRAAQLTITDSVLAGPSAARRHGIAIRDTATYLAVGPEYHHRLPGVRLLRDEIPDRDLMLLDGVLLTDRARTIFDCLRVLPDPDAVELLDRALQAKWITLEMLAARVHRFAGRHGAKRLARLSHLAGSGARSAAERVAVALLRAHGLGGWRANVEIYDEQGLIGVGDIVFGTAGLVVELDGHAHHVTPDQFQHDRQRQNRLVAAGWTVLRFTWQDLTRRPHEVAATIRAILDQARSPSAVAARSAATSRHR
jgi:very-short-patch-repair endonuclease